MDFNDFSSEIYGGEDEYNFKGLIGGIEALLTDISTLTKAPNKFIKISISSERTNIVTYLTWIDTYFPSPDTYLSQFEALKILIRGIISEVSQIGRLNLKAKLKKQEK